jgi:hypothetical protein
MALASLPVFVLHKIRNLSFNFLWLGCTTSHRLHLGSWDVLANPKQKVGWGLRNILFFNLALSTNTLWCVLTNTGIWHTFIMDKFLPLCFDVAWLILSPSISRSASYTWRNLARMTPLISHWISWIAGSSQCIHIGKDRILGLGHSSFLSA